MDIAKEISIEIHKDANKERSSFDLWYCNYDKHMNFDRLLEYNYITRVEFSLDDSDGNGKD